VIRRARPEDAEAVTRIFRESRAEAMPWLPVLHTEEEDRSWFRGALAGEAYVFEAGGTIVGYAALREDELHDLYVAPGAQRQGVGSALLAHVQEVRPNGFHFWAFRDNSTARRFYDSRGCRVIRETDGADNEEKMPDVLYEWLPTSPNGEGAEA